MGKHNKNLKHRYKLGQRYSVEVINKKRQTNLFNYLSKLSDEKKNNYDLSNLNLDYETQKKPKVRIKCLKHNNHFHVSPHDFLRYDGGGCKQCENEIRSLTKFKNEREKFLAWFYKNHSKLEMISEFRGMTKLTKIKCSKHKKTSEIIPSVFMHQNTHGCLDCAYEKVRDSRLLSKQQIIEKIRSKKKNNIQLVDVIYNAKTKTTNVIFKCSIHGTQEPVDLRYVRNSSYLCVKCGKSESGYASEKLKELISKKEKGKIASIALIKIIFNDIEALKIGVTTRTLKERYGKYLKEIYFHKKLYEVYAYKIEKDLLEHFRNNIDTRIFLSGLRNKKRFKGDTEILCWSQFDKLKSYLYEQIKNLDIEEINESK